MNVKQTFNSLLSQMWIDLWPNDYYYSNVSVVNASMKTIYGYIFKCECDSRRLSVTMTMMAADTAATVACTTTKSNRIKCNIHKKEEKIKLVYCHCVWWTQINTDHTHKLRDHQKVSHRHRPQSLIVSPLPPLPPQFQILDGFHFCPSARCDVVVRWMSVSGMFCHQFKTCLFVIKLEYCIVYYTMLCHVGRRILQPFNCLYLFCCSLDWKN